MKLPITVIGSYPKPKFLKLTDWFSTGSDGCCKTAVARDQYKEETTLKDPKEAAALERQILKATSQIVREQVDLGIHVPTDGEVRRDNYVYAFCRSLSGVSFEAEDLTSQTIRQVYTCLCPTVTGKLGAPAKPSVVDEWRKAQALCPYVPIKITLPGPMTICDTIAVDQAIDTGVYKDRAEICEDLVPILRREVMALVDAGCKHIQLDEPVFARRVDDALSYGVANMDKIFAGVPADVVRSVHLCCGYPNHLDDVDYPHAPKDCYMKLAPALDNSDIQWISLEDAHCRNDISKLLPLFKHKTIIFGAITVHRSIVESVKMIQDRIEEALQYLPIERMVLAPDCGLGFLPDDIRKQKLRNLVEARKNILAGQPGGDGDDGQGSAKRRKTSPSSSPSRSPSR